MVSPPPPSNLRSSQYPLEPAPQSPPPETCPPALSGSGLPSCLSPTPKTHQKTFKLLKRSNLHLPPKYELIQYVVSLLKVEDDVQLTN